MAKLLKSLLVMMVVTMPLMFSSCGDDEPDEEDYIDLDFNEIRDLLQNKSWKLTSSKGKNINNVRIGDIFTFSSEPYYENPYIYAFYMNGQKVGSYILLTDGLGQNPRLSIELPMDEYFEPFIKAVTSDRLVLEDENTKCVFSRINDGNTGNTGNIGNETTYERPEIYYTDFTPYITAMKVVYRIANKDRTKVTSAKGYCGSKSVNGSIGSGTITFNFTGLSRGTKYKVYCTADGPGGSATSDVVTLSTLY